MSITKEHELINIQKSAILALIPFYLYIEIGLQLSIS